ncbi:MAG TPA: hypothetical protein PLH72_07510 [Vicinamibacterales bacterium]|nr:hypothetical protein [Vicinamibacterales bacterium]
MGKTGNQVLREVLGQMSAEGALTRTCHPHSAALLRSPTAERRQQLLVSPGG